MTRQSLPRLRGAQIHVERVARDSGHCSSLSINDSTPLNRTTIESSQRGKHDQKPTTNRKKTGDEICSSTKEDGEAKSACEEEADRQEKEMTRLREEDGCWWYRSDPTTDKAMELNIPLVLETALEIADRAASSVE